MTTLTGNEDTDVEIINSLNLDDLRSVCRTNQYASNLCQNHITLKSRINNIKKKVTNIMSLITDGYYMIILQPYYGIKFRNFHKIMNNIEIIELASPEGDLHPSNIFNNYKVELLRVFESDTNKYGIQYGLNDFYDMDLTFFIGTEDQLVEFLTQIYYNKLILMI